MARIWRDDECWIVQLGLPDSGRLDISFGERNDVSRGEILGARHELVCELPERAHLSKRRARSVRCWKVRVEGSCDAGAEGVSLVAFVAQPLGHALLCRRAQVYRLLWRWHGVQQL